MGTINSKPEAVLRLTELDVNAVRVLLCQHWVVLVQEKQNYIEIELYQKE